MSEARDLEREDWLESLDSVEAFEGLERVDELLDAVVTSARRKGAKLPFAANTAYVNTIPPDRQPPASRRPAARNDDPPLRALERRGDRACAPTRKAPSSAAISRASSRRRRSTTPASCISGARPATSHGGDLVYFQGHSSPGIYARAFLEGRLSEEQLVNFRQEVGGHGPVVLSASLADAGFLAVPDRLDGPGAA